MICKKCNVYMQPKVYPIDTRRWTPFWWKCTECGREYPRVPHHSIDFGPLVEVSSKYDDYPPLNWLVKGIPE